MALAVDTIVVMMGMARLPLIRDALKAGGMPPDTPVAIVENGTNSHQRVVTGSLDTIEAAAGHAKIKPPAVIVIGKVVNMAERIAWFRGRNGNMGTGQ